MLAVLAVRRRGAVMARTLNVQVNRRLARPAERTGADSRSRQVQADMVELARAIRRHSEDNMVISAPTSLWRATSTRRPPSCSTLVVSGPARHPRGTAASVLAERRELFPFTRSPQRDWRNEEFG